MTESLKSTWWSVTAYNDEIEILEDSTKFPQFVVAVHGGRETCPTTGRLHFQGAIQCKSQQRRSALKKWLPTSHLEAAHHKDALLKYALKSETAAGPKLTTQNSRKFLTMSDALTIIGTHNIGVDYIQVMQSLDLKPKDALKQMYWKAVRIHIATIPDDISLFSQPQMLAAWVNTHEVWIQHARATVLQLAREQADASLSDSRSQDGLSNEE